MPRELRSVKLAGADVPLMTTTLWDHRSRQHGKGRQGDDEYTGTTPAYITWNLLERYSRPKELVVDPMAGSGTTLDVARDKGRKGLGYDLQPQRDDIFKADARKLPLEDRKAHFVFLAPPCSDHVKYSGDDACLAELDAHKGPAYFKAMDQVLTECHRILKPGRYMALYISDSFKKGRGFVPLGFGVYDLMLQYFEPVDIMVVARHSRSLQKPQWHDAAVDGNYFLRGFHYLFLVRRPEKGRRRGKGRR